jgi:hypothetical protein
VDVPCICVEFMIVTTPLALTLSVVTDIPVPFPVRVVPLGRFEHVADESVKSASNVRSADSPAPVLRQPAWRPESPKLPRVVSLRTPSPSLAESYTHAMGHCQTLNAVALQRAVLATDALASCRTASS